MLLGKLLDDLWRMRLLKSAGYDLICLSRYHRDDKMVYTATLKNNTTNKLIYGTDETVVKALDKAINLWLESEPTNS